MTDEAVVARVLDGDLDAFAILMRRHNGRVFRTTRSILRNDAEAEDAAQDAWISACRGLAGFEHRASFSSWLTRIAVRAALARARSARPLRSIDELDQVETEDERESPEWDAHRHEIARVIETALDELPPSYRAVIVLRDIEHMSTGEAAEALGVAEENLRVRLHRARGVLRERLVDELGMAVVDAFKFDGDRCDRMVERVMRVLRADASREGD